MAERPVFKYKLDRPFCIEDKINFEYYSGFSRSQKQKCIKSLHEAYLSTNKNSNILEISSKSMTVLGIELSAFNLMIKNPDGSICAVENAFQAGKVFECGGPYVDILNKSPKDAKKDERLLSSGSLKSFSYFKFEFPLFPVDYFYNWLYISALYQHKEYISELIQYDAFTDIEFNPKRSINCQAKAAARFVGLYKSNLLEKALESPQVFKDVVYNKNEDSDCGDRTLF